MAVAVAGAPAARRERVTDAPLDRPLRAPVPADDRPQPLGPARGIAIALGVGAIAWTLIAVFLFIR
jgi:hypothetical protein